MTESFGLFDAADPEAPDRVYSAAVLMSVMAKFLRDGIVHADGDGLAVSATTPAAMSIDVGTGAAIVQGRYYLNDEALTLAVEAADPSNPRIDRVVLRLDATLGRTIHAVVLQGTPAASPVAPTLTRTAETWELSLAQIVVGAGVTSIVAGNITDERGNATLCGTAAPVYVPSSQLEVVGAVDMLSNLLTGLPAPSGSTDATRKGYVDALVAAAIASFAISQITIDANKNWNGKNITNVAEFGVATLNDRVAGAGITVKPVYASISDTLQTSVDAQTNFPSYTANLNKMREITLSEEHVGTANSYRVKFDLVYSAPSTSSGVEGAVYLNDVQVGTLHSAVGSGGAQITNVTEDLTGLKAGDKIQIYGRTSGTAWGSSHGGVKNFRIYADLAEGFVISATNSVTL